MNTTIPLTGSHANYIADLSWSFYTHGNDSNVSWNSVSSIALNSHSPWIISNVVFVMFFSLFVFQIVSSHCTIKIPLEGDDDSSSKNLVYYLCVMLISLCITGFKGLMQPLIGLLIGNIELTRFPNNDAMSHAHFADSETQFIHETFVNNTFALQLTDQLVCFASVAFFLYFLYILDIKTFAKVNRDAYVLKLFIISIAFMYQIAVVLQINLNTDYIFDSPFSTSITTTTNTTIDSSTVIKSIPLGLYNYIVIMTVIYLLSLGFDSSLYEWNFFRNKLVYLYLYMIGFLITTSIVCTPFLGFYLSIGILWFLLLLPLMIIWQCIKTIQKHRRDVTSFELKSLDERPLVVDEQDSD
jgi:hypothetical protein